MAFYSYVMVQNVHVGIEATLHVVGEQRDTTESFWLPSQQTHAWMNVEE